MEAPEDSRHPALKFLQENAILIGIVAVIVVSLIVIVVKQGAADERAAAPVPTIIATAGAATPKATAAQPSASSAASSAATASASASPSAAASQAPAASGKPTASPTPTEAPLVGGTNQTVLVENWRSYAEEFATAYGSTAGGKSAWLARMRPLVTDDLYAGFKLTDINRVEALTFSSISTMTEENAFATFTASYKEKPELIDGLIQVQNDGSWKVHKVSKHED